MPDNFLPIQEYASLVGKSPVTVRQKCQRGTIPGAIKIGRDWLIPSDAPYEDSRIRSGKYIDWRKKSSE